MCVDLPWLLMFLNWTPRVVVVGPITGTSNSTRISRRRIGSGIVSSCKQSWVTHIVRLNFVIKDRMQKL